MTSQLLASPFQDLTHTYAAYGFAATVHAQFLFDLRPTVDIAFDILALSMSTTITVYFLTNPPPPRFLTNEQQLPDTARCAIAPQTIPADVGIG